MVDDHENDDPVCWKCGDTIARGYQVDPAGNKRHVECMPDSSE